MAVPDYQSLMEPLLRYASDGREYRLAEAIDAIATNLGLTDDERQELIPSGGERRFDNRIGWARTYLTKAGLLETPRRARFRITARGHEVLVTHAGRIDNRVLKQYPEFVDFQSQGRPSPAAVSSTQSLFDMLDSEPSVTVPPTTETRDEPQKMTYANAAFDVLHRAGGGPLHAREILQAAVDEFLIQPHGKTPVSSISSIMLRDPRQRFKNVGKNRWCLARSDDDPLGDPSSDNEQERREPRFWLEKARVAGRPHRQTGPDALGQTLLSPQRSSNGRDIYSAMREVQPGDVIFHLVDNRRIERMSVVAATVDATGTGPLTSNFADKPAYRVGLRDCVLLEPPIEKTEFLNVVEQREELLSLLRTHEHLFYNKNLQIAEGGYLTRVPRELVSMWDAVYEHKTRRHLPYLSSDDLQRVSPPPVVEEELSSPKVWLFQANPRLYNLAEQLQVPSHGLTTFTRQDGRFTAGDEDDWTVTRYRNEMQAGDLVLLYQGGPAAGIYALGELLAAPEPRVYVGEPPPWVRAKPTQGVEEWRVRFRYVQVLAEPLMRPTLTAHPVLRQMLILRAPQGTNFKLTPEEWTALQELLIETQPPPVQHAVRPVYHLADVAACTGLDEPTLAEWVRAIERKGQAVLYGPPGTGKTFVARQLAEHLVGGGDGLLELVQFHPAYTYEDFIQGLRPSVGPEGGVEITLVPGRLLDFCARARERTGRSVLLIDELNRANLARVFGELMYLLEYRNEQIPLAGGGVLALPANVYLLGTMNTADRSIALVDHALRRRFAFLRLAPLYEPLLRFHVEHAALVNRLIALLRRLNREIADPHYELGTSFFFHTELAGQLGAIWRMEIEPYLEEYFFDQPEKAELFRWSRVRAELDL